MENKLVSIIVSVYNGERYIEECIESVLNQDYKNIELILVDDGSFDSSNVILDKYSLKDKRVKVIHKENSGVSNSRNIALERSLGEYICFLDQDDILAKDYVSYFMALFVNTMLKYQLLRLQGSFLTKLLILYMKKIM